ncbi:MAG TPA: alkaline phosphatase family protein [Verrucomicrobiae bacterium]|nr:alkaline phosphatase family protein [Verrucomicrobiae bacterium]
MHHPKSIHQTNAALLAAAAGLALAAPASSAQPFPVSPDGDVFVIAMENHNFTQPTNMASPQQILGNPGAPYLNSLVTPGNPNAAQVSYAAAYFNAAHHDHPSEPNYVWAEAGTDFGVHTDADPRSTNGNTFYAGSIHLTTLLNAAGISWKNYQEDLDLTSSPTNSAYGTNGPVNPYNGTTQFNYAVKHNPMAFFADTSVQNVYPLAQFFTDLANGTVGRYNWITPDQYNDAHSSLNNGFTYNGVHYTGDQSSIAAGDSFLSQVIPQIMATPEYQNNGVIIIWWDESEGGDDTAHTVPEIVISPLAKGNAYASSVPMSHSSDIKTMEELFGLPFLNNPIPAYETNNFGGYDNVATVNDLGDLFVPGAIPSFNVTAMPGNLVYNPRTGTYSQVVRITNTGTAPAEEPLYLVLDNLSTNATLLNAAGVTSILMPLGSPYVQIPACGNSVLGPNESRTVKLEFSDPTTTGISYSTRVLSVVPTP